MLFCQLIDWVCERAIPGDFTFDSYFTNAAILNHIHSKPDRFGRPRGYVGDLKFNRKIEWKGKIVRADEHRRSLSGDAARDPADHAGLGHPANHREIQEL